MTKPYGGHYSSARAATNKIMNIIKASTIIYQSRGGRMLVFLDGNSEEIDVDDMSSDWRGQPFHIRQIVMNYLFTPILRRHSGDE